MQSYRLIICVIIFDYFDDMLPNRLLTSKTKQWAENECATYWLGGTNVIHVTFKFSYNKIFCASAMNKKQTNKQKPL